MARNGVLIICDGWGYSPDSFGNAVAMAQTPCVDELVRKWPHTVVAASGEAVGLPNGQQGNSEVGHLTIGAGRIIRQPLTRINCSIYDGSFFENDVLKRCMRRVKSRGSLLHCIGLISDGGVHSAQDHAIALVHMAQQEGVGDVAVHVITDGRDVPPTSAAEYVGQFSRELVDIPGFRVASIGGRYWAMDRDSRWDRVEEAYDVLTDEDAPVVADAVEYIHSQYADGITDEFIAPMRINAPAGRRNYIADGDSVIFFNFRPDRSRQLCHALLDDVFSGFSRRNVRKNIDCVTFTSFDSDLDVRIAFQNTNISMPLAEVISTAGKLQFHIAETEKYAHVTYFINGGREQPFLREDRNLIPSAKVATYDEKPEMRAREITSAVLQRLRSHDDVLIIINFANPDMVGHTGNFQATVKAIEIVDECIGRIVQEVLSRQGVVLITSDHGNAEMKIDARDNSPLTSHTINPVPVILCGAECSGMHSSGGLQDIAPTLLEGMGWKIPPEMEGTSLIIPTA